ncbi:uncharacterized protein B0H18DRAFT_961160 [Fomitopsis serialis]|uniref:uncharacterized protein n=1 Tax=Fomitopsis serialis TaxID=139415 RepID=UPI002007FD25|nr:uncharacterized protein B0H18DRAFT_961160 [Neoantrodia serialis]KAH9912328.1 hypothetical protein B0H18DRAFT_961160 [Neoantrodia serialis]
MNTMLAELLADSQRNIMIPKALKNLAEAKQNPAMPGALNNFLVGISVSALMIGLQELLKPEVAATYGLTEAMTTYCEIVAPRGSKDLAIVTNVIEAVSGIAPGQSATPAPTGTSDNPSCEHNGKVFRPPEDQLPQTVPALPESNTPEAVLQELRESQRNMDQIIAEQLGASREQYRRLEQQLELEKLRDGVTVRAEQISRAYLPRFPNPPPLSPEMMPGRMSNDLFKWFEQLGGAMQTMDMYIRAELNFWHAAARANAAEWEAWQRGMTPRAPAVASHFRVTQAGE